MPLDLGDRPAAPGLLPSNRLRGLPPTPLAGDEAPPPPPRDDEPPPREPVGDCGGNAPRAGVLLDNWLLLLWPPRLPAARIEC